MADEKQPSVPAEQLREFVNGMRKNAEMRETTERQDALAAIEQHWAGELEELVEQHE